MAKRKQSPAQEEAMKENSRLGLIKGMKKNVDAIIKDFPECLVAGNNAKFALGSLDRAIRIRQRERMNKK